MDAELKKIGEELARIADALEVVAGKAISEVTEEKPKRGRKPKEQEVTVVPEDNIVSNENTIDESPEIKTAEDLKLYCNEKLVNIENVLVRSETVKKIIAHFKKKYGVAAITDLKSQHIPEALRDFNSMLGVE